MSVLPDSQIPVIVDAVRTPIGRFRGALSPVRPDDLAAHVIRSLVSRNPAAAEQIQDVYFGAANQAGEDNRNVARMGLLLAGLPVEIPGVTVNRLCGSGMEAVLQAAKSIMVGEGEVYLAGGSESMTRAPFVMPRAEQAFPMATEVHNTALGWRLINKKMEELYPIESLGMTAENVAERYGVSREDQDAWALKSHQKAAIAQDENRFEQEIVPLEVPQGRKKPPINFSADECVRRDTSAEKLATLKPAFKKDGSVTAGNSSPLNDGSACLLITSLAKAKTLNAEPLARIVGWGHAGVHPGIMGIGPVPASQNALKRIGWTAKDIDCIELNEAFAAQTVASVRELKLDPDRVNMAGGAIALGHPLGCSGARILTTLAYQMKQRELSKGLASMCIGVGQGIACLLERV